MNTAIQTPIACTLSAEILNELIALTPVLDQLLVQSQQLDKDTRKQQQMQLLYSMYQLDEGESSLSYTEFIFQLKMQTPAKRKSNTPIMQQQLTLFDIPQQPVAEPSLTSNDSSSQWLANIWKTHQQPWVWTDQQHFKQHLSMLTDQPANHAYRSVQIGVFHHDKLIYRAPQATMLENHVKELFRHLQHSNIHPLIASFILHFNLYFTCPFMQHNHYMSCYWHYLFAKCKYTNYAQLNIFAYFVKHQQAYKHALEEGISQSDAAVFVMFCLQALKAQIKPLYGASLPLPPTAALDTTNTSEEAASSTPQHAAATPLVSAQALPNSSVIRLLRLYKRNPQSVFSNALLMQKLKLKHRPTFKENYLGPALDKGYLCMLYPEIPKHPQQRYVLTNLGLNVLNAPVSINNLLRR